MQLVMETPATPNLPAMDMELQHVMELVFKRLVHRFVTKPRMDSIPATEREGLVTAPIPVMEALSIRILVMVTLVIILAGKDTRVMEHPIVMEHIPKIKNQPVTALPRLVTGVAPVMEEELVLDIIPAQD